MIEKQPLDAEFIIDELERFVLSPETKEAPDFDTSPLGFDDFWRQWFDAKLAGRTKQ